MDTNPSPSRLQHQQQQEQASDQQMANRSQTRQEFASVEDALRFDAGQTSPPPAIAERLKVSLETGPPPKRSFWQRVFGG